VETVSNVRSTIQGIRGEVQTVTQPYLLSLSGGEEKHELICLQIGVG
jgi:hypothetical protein